MCVQIIITIFTIYLQNHLSDFNAVFGDGFRIDWCMVLDRCYVYNSSGGAVVNICFCKSMLPSISKIIGPILMRFFVMGLGLIGVCC